ncbi:MAG TPA: hypothetical protein VNL77_21785 [Roseiflexaceae bacterium]|nr:hypothetical protein [Roseiflexaceae bacterium]
MTVEVTISLPDDLARQAEAGGLLAPGAIEDLLRNELRRRQRHPTLDRALGLLASDRPPPADEEVARWLEERRIERYG